MNQNIGFFSRAPEIHTLRPKKFTDKIFSFRKMRAKLKLLG
jgi:hypothetical protein